MSHISESVLRGYVDEELSAPDLEVVEKHLRECSTCAVALDSIRERAQRVANQLNELAPAEHSPSQAAYVRFRERRATRFSVRWGRGWVAAAVATILLIGAFSLEPVRVAASGFLRLFRAQQITVVKIDPARLEQLNQDFFGPQHRARFEQLFSDHVRIVTHGSPLKTTEQSNAVARAGFGVRLPFSLGAPSRFEVQPATDVTILIDVGRIRTLLAEAGREDINVPDNLDGENIFMNIAAPVAAFYGDCPEKVEGERRQNHWMERECKVLVQMPSPVVAVPPQLNERELGQTFLELLGMSEDQARSLTENIDWAGTLVLPIPVDPRLKHTETEVDGVQGVLIEHAGRGVFHLIWLRDGILYNLMGNGTAEDATAIANTMM